MHCADPINKEINQTFTIVSQIKGKLTETVFLCTPEHFAPIYTTLHTTYILDFYLNSDPHGIQIMNCRYLH